jgi:hypothetical protein
MIVCSWGVRRRWVDISQASKLIGLEQIALQRGMNLTPHLKRVGIDPAVLRRPDAYVDYEAICRLLESCATAWDLPDIAARRDINISTFLCPVA